MKKLLVAVLAVMAVTFLTAGFAMAAVLNTAHDLSAAYSAAGNTETCVHCHTPHRAEVASGPLWNRVAETTFTSVGPESLACLSCHDGTMGNLVNTPGTGAGALGQPDYTGMAPTGDTVIATDDATLADDHPVGVTYPSTADFVSAASLPAGMLKGGGDQVECGSCHDPHNDTNDPFLRMSNAASALCTTCHVK